MEKIPSEIKGWAAPEKGARLKQIEVPAPKLGDHDVMIEVTACGICHSDIHLIDNDWQISHYPLVPGHEIIGRVTAKGKHVRNPKVGTVVGVGWQRGSCLECDECVSGNDNFCNERIATCVDHPGGYANYHVTDARFCFEIPENLARPETAPLLCGGATVYTPLVELLGHKSRKDCRVGVIGIGGLGHLAIKMAHAMGYEVTAFSSSSSKESEARKLGAHSFISSADPSQLRKAKNSLDLVINTAAMDLPWSSYLSTLRVGGSLCFVGVPPSNLSFHAGELMNRKLNVTSSVIGSRAMVRDMLEFCARNEILPDCEIFTMDQANEAITKVRENKVRFRAVLSNANRN